MVVPGAKKFVTVSIFLLVEASKVVSCIFFRPYLSRRKDCIVFTSELLKPPKVDEPFEATSTLFVERLTLILRIYF